MGQRMPADRRVWAAFFGMGLLNNLVPFSLLVWSQTHVAGGLASILNATTPIFTVIVAHFLTGDEKMTGGRLIGVVAGFAGVVLMIGPAALDGFGTNVLAQLAALGAACSSTEGWAAWPPPGSDGCPASIGRADGPGYGLDAQGPMRQWERLRSGPDVVWLAVQDFGQHAEVPIRDAERHRRGSPTWSFR